MKLKKVLNGLEAVKTIKYKDVLIVKTNNDVIPIKAEKLLYLDVDEMCCAYL